MQMYNVYPEKGLDQNVQGGGESREEVVGKGRQNKYENDCQRLYVTAHLQMNSKVVSHVAGNTEC